MNAYLIAKAFHLISMTAWMAGMFYLPRLYVYHAAAPVGSEVSEQFKIMERRLLRAIINPAMILTFTFGIWLLIQTHAGRPQHWFDAKFVLLLVMVGLHGVFSKTRKQFDRDQRPHTPRYYKILNETVTLVFMAIVLLAVLKPF